MLPIPEMVQTNFGIDVCGDGDISIPEAWMEKRRKRPPCE